MAQARVTIYDLDSMKARFMEGMQISTPLGKATLLHKYKNFAQTDKGNWKWVEIYLAENGTVCEDRKKLINQKREEIKAYYEDKN